MKTENDGDKIIDQISRDSKLFNIRLEQDVRFSYCNTLRPVIKNSLAETSCLGPEFAGILSVEQSFSQLIPVITTDVPVRSFNSSLTIQAQLAQEIIRTHLIFHCLCILLRSGFVV